MLEFSPLCIGRLNMENKFKIIFSNIDSVHLDIMDETFVKNKAFTVDEVNNFTNSKPKHIHIMSKNLTPIINALNSTSDTISFHYEATNYPENIINLIRKKKIKPGIVINPETDVSSIASLVSNVSRVILMAVTPGFSGQEFISSTLKKINHIRKLSKNVEIVIDGGINDVTAAQVTSLGANSCVVCSVIVKAKNTLEKITSLKEICNRNYLTFCKKQ